MSHARDERMERGGHKVDGQGDGTTYREGKRDKREKENT